MGDTGRKEVEVLINTINHKLLKKYNLFTVIGNDFTKSFEEKQIMYVKYSNVFLN